MKHGIDPLSCKAGAGSIVNGDEITGRVSDGDGFCDSFEPFPTTVDHRQAQKGNIGGISAEEFFAILSSDGDDDLADIITIQERFHGPEPDWAAIKLLKDLFFVGFAEPGRLPGGWQNHGE